MTVSTTKNRIVFVGDGATKLFGFDFKVIKAEHAKVYLVVNDVETLLILGTEYTISGLNNDTGGAVEIETPPATGTKIVIVREVLPIQETSFINQGRFYPEVHESAFDYVTMVMQQLSGAVGSSDGSSRLLALGVADIDGDGAYRAKGNRIVNVGDPVNENDVTRLKDIKPFADQAEAAQAAAENAQAAAEAAESAAAQSATDAAASAAQIDPTTYYTKAQTNTMFENLFENLLDYFPVGFEMDWSHDLIPDGWLEENGYAIDPVLYPKLALLYPDLMLPDCSDRYIRYIGNKSGYTKYQLLGDTIQHFIGGFGGATYATGNLLSGCMKYSWGSLGVLSAGGAGGGVIEFNPTAGGARTSTETRPKTIMIKTRIIKAK